MDSMEPFLELIETIIEILLERGKNGDNTTRPSENIDIYDYLAEKIKSQKNKKDRP